MFFRQRFKLTWRALLSYALRNRPNLSGCRWNTVSAPRVGTVRVLGVAVRPAIGGGGEGGEISLQNCSMGHMFYSNQRELGAILLIRALGPTERRHLLTCTPTWMSRLYPQYPPRCCDPLARHAMLGSFPSFPFLKIVLARSRQKHEYRNNIRLFK